MATRATHNVDGSIAEAYRAAVSVSGGVEPRAVHREAVVDQDVAATTNHRDLCRLVLWSPIGQRAGEAHHAVLVAPQRLVFLRCVMKAAILLIHVVHNDDAVAHCSRFFEALSDAKGAAALTLRAIILNARCWQQRSASEDCLSVEQTVAVLTHAEAAVLVRRGVV